LVFFCFIKPHKLIKQRLKFTTDNIIISNKTVNKMALFLPSNVQPLDPAADIQSWNDQSISGLENAEFFKLPKGSENRSVELNYTQL